ncbi:hypothetical protein HU200_019767 [Digitaria exilis]|uniref:No apical meristem-associated C-terminal domain-containing protein n=1 Tax=Digitaria exilis TaxID=1010633 RepID=A0A835KF37_9POAL|nr:hypothetical protein HU200_019767 [Digitaria exilis]
MSYFGNHAQNSHFVGAPIHNSPFSSPLCTNNDASSPPSVECLQGNGNGNIRTEKRIMWTIEEEVRVMSAWIEHSTDSSCGADRGDLFECAYVKARRVFTSGYSDQMWIDAAHNFYVVDNKEAGLGPYVLMEVWKICRDVPKWKTYNEELRNARKRKSYHLEGDSQEEEAIPDDMPKRPIGQKQAKMVARAANGKNKESGDESGNSKESPVDLNKFAKYSKFQEENHEKRLQILHVQQKLSSEKIEASKIAHLTAQENKEVKKLEKESKMMEAYLMKTVSAPQSVEDKLFSLKQEGTRKDVECAFGVLQARFDIVRRPARLWKQADVINIMQACVVLHNMIVENEKEAIRDVLDLNYLPSATIVIPSDVRTNDNPNPNFAEALRINSAIRARPTHRKLKKDLIDHIWQRYGNKEN